jgi:signal transduction histidine kinase
MSACPAANTSCRGLLVPRAWGWQTWEEIDYHVTKVFESPLLAPAVHCTHLVANEKGIAIEDRLIAVGLEIVNATLKATVKEQRHHLGIAAHDLRSPLAVILAYSELLQDGLKSSEERELIQQVIQSTEFMQSLVGNILDLESVRSGAPIPMKCNCWLTSLLDVAPPTMFWQSDRVSR